MEIGDVYRVNHLNLPERLSFHLGSIRTVMVTRLVPEPATVVTISYPSKKSLATFFGNDNDNNNNDQNTPPTTGLMQPNLDRSYTMSLDLARKVLRDRISFEEFATRRADRSFWLVVKRNTTDNNNNNNNGSKMVLVNNKRNNNRSSVVVAGWGKRKKVTYVREKGMSSSSSNTVRNRLVSFSVGTKQETEVKMEEDDDIDMLLSRKRKTDRCEVGEISNHKMKKQRMKKKKKMKMTTMKKTKQKPPVEIGATSITNTDGNGNNNNEDHKLRWSEQRYKLAEHNILKILKQKHAVYGNPILRADLRTEARKLIGDTGLLDHLLKHMAGKLAPEGKERFRRRHNPDGIMEYWIENAELVDIRREAGIDDPYWTPPQGWCRGDPVNMDANCVMEIKRLRDDMDKLKREFVEVGSVSGKNKEMVVVVNEQSGLDGTERMKAKQEELLRRKAMIDEQLHLVSIALDTMQEDIDMLLKEAAETNKTRESNRINNTTTQAIVVATSADAINEPDDDLQNSTTKQQNDTKTTILMKSAFRICQPVGAFLWPHDNMATATTATALPVLPFSSDQQQVVIQVVPEDVLFASSYSSSSSPLSVSSTTSSPLQQAPLIKPVPKRLAATANASCRNTTGFVNHVPVPDLNELPLDVAVAAPAAYPPTYHPPPRQQQLTPPTPSLAALPPIQSPQQWSFLPSLVSPSQQPPSVPSIIRRRRLQQQQQQHHGGKQTVLTIKPPSSFSTQQNTATPTSFLFPSPNTNGST